MPETTQEQQAVTQTSDATSQTLQPIGSESLNLPNLITLSRLVLAIILFWLIWYKGYWITAAVLFVVAASTDFLDGYIARKYGQITTLGRILDPFVDKIIVCGAFIFLLEKKVLISPEKNIEAWSGVSAWMVVLVVGREMFVTSLRGFLEKYGLDFSANVVGKLKMVVQCVAVTASLLSLSPDIREHFPSFPILRDVLLWIMVIVTAYSGISYVMRAVRMLKNMPQSVEK